MANVKITNLTALTSPATNDVIPIVDTSLGITKKVTVADLGGALAIIPSGEIILFYKDTAVTGYTLQDSLDDKVVFVTKGSAAGGEVGGAEHSGGTWTQPNHTHTGPSHWHDVDVGQLAIGGVGWKSASGGANFTSDRNFSSPGTISRTCAATRSSSNGTGATGASATANTWRPAAYSFTMQQKN